MTMRRNEESQRVVIALTETSPVADLWEAAMQAIGGSNAELTVIFVHDERWHRAASLPFTREISQSGGSSNDFTLQRAEQLLAATAASLRKNIEELAERAGLPVAFQVLPETDPTQSLALLSLGASVVVGPSGLEQHPLFLGLRRTNLRIVFIGPEDKGNE
jgi:hypothetical protein